MWRLIPGKLKYVSGSGKSEIFGVNGADAIFRCQKPCIGEWEIVPGKLTQCDATFDAVIGVNKGSAIFRLGTGI